MNDLENKAKTRDNHYKVNFAFVSLGICHLDNTCGNQSGEEDTKLENCLLSVLDHILFLRLIKFILNS
jgi:hypothetical protein